MLIRAAFVAASALALIACGGGVDARQKEVNDLRAEIVKLRAEQGALSERLDAIQLGRAGALGASKAPAPATEGAPGAGDRPDLDVVKLGPDSSAAGGDDAGDGAPATTLKMVGSSVDKSAKGGDDFQRGLDLYRKKQWDKALDAFAAYLVKSPDAGNADLATFYRGDCYFQKGENKRAAEQFSAVASGFPQSSKAPDALLKLSQAQAKSGDKASSDQTKKKLRDTYPSSDAAKKLEQKKP